MVRIELVTLIHKFEAALPYQKGYLQLVDCEISFSGINRLTLVCSQIIIKFWQKQSPRGVPATLLEKRL